MDEGDRLGTTLTRLVSQDGTREALTELILFVGMLGEAGVINTQQEDHLLHLLRKRWDDKVQPLEGDPVEPDEAKPDEDASP